MVDTKNGAHRLDTTVRTEIIAGMTTFLTMSYAIIVIPSVLSTPGTGIVFSGALTATVLLSFLLTLLMGVYARLPFAVAPGLGVNALVTYTVILKDQVPWPVAFGMVFWAGVLFLICSVTPIRRQIAQAIPLHIRAAAAIGIGVFLSFIGLKNLGLVASDSATLLRFGSFSDTSWMVLVGFCCTVFLMHRKSHLAFIVGILVITFLALAMGKIEAPSTLWSWPDFSSTFLQLDVVGALKFSLLPSVIAIFFTDLFDSISTLMGCSHAAGMLDKRGEPLRFKEGLVVDSWATLLAGPFGTSAGTAYLESAAGIEAGGRRGLTAIVCAFCFLPFLFLAPLAAMVPIYATAPILVLVGAQMFRSTRDLSINRMEELVPAFLTIVMIPLTFSITQGLLWGIVTHAIMFILSGRRKELSIGLMGIALLSAALLILESTRY